MEWSCRGKDICFYHQGKQLLTLIGKEKCKDELRKIGIGIYEWRRICVPTSQMEMEIHTAFIPDFYMIPGINYNGNGFGTFCEYTDDRYHGFPWKYGWHRASVPAMTQSQGRIAGLSVSTTLLGQPNDHSCMSMYKDGDYMVQKIIWPETEEPRQLHLYRFGTPFYTQMDKKACFVSYLVIETEAIPKMGYKKALEFAFLKEDSKRITSYSPKQIEKLGITFAKNLYTEEADGFCGFNIGLYYENGAWRKRSANKYEIGWCGQNALLANALLREAVCNPTDIEAKEIGFSVLDSWIRYAYLPIGVIHSYYDPGQIRYLEACNMGTAGIAYFEAYDLAKELGIKKESYKKTAYDICTFAIKHQKKNGAFAKCWKEDGSVAIEEGTVGAFLAMPLIEAYKRSRDASYLAAAVHALEHYYAELEEEGFTTAGALDIFSIDKESSIPLFKCAIMLYEVTREEKWLLRAENAAWYLSTWQYTCTEKFNQDTTLGQTGYDSYGGTLVSTVHEGMDSFALSYIPELYKLSKYTGKSIWTKRANAIWINGCQHLSDGTLVINGKERPAGSQDESYELSRQSVWGSCSEWLVAWPGAFRLDALAKCKNKIEEIGYD